MSIAKAREVLAEAELTRWRTLPSDASSKDYDRREREYHQLHIRAFVEAADELVEVLRHRKDRAPKWLVRYMSRQFQSGSHVRFRASEALVALCRGRRSHPFRRKPWKGGDA